MTPTLEVTPTLASPSWWGADSTRERIATDSGVVFVKTMTPFSRAYADAAAAFAAAVAAGESGIGPRVLAAAPEQGRLELEDLTETHKTGTLYDFLDPARLAAIAALRRSVSELRPAVTRRAVVFDEIRKLRESALARNAQLPADLSWLLRSVGDFEKRVEAAGYDLVFAHGDGNASNTMLHLDTGQIALLDWDAAGLMDPMQDLGTLLGEFARFDDEGRALFEAYWGSFDASLYARARLYAAADALKWGLIGAFADAADPGTFEYSKFSDWSFTWARNWLAPERTDDLIRLI
jgi:hypothetical protein